MFIRSLFFTDVEPVATVDSTWVFILVGGVTFCVVVIVIAITVYKEYPEWRGGFRFCFRVKVCHCNNKQKLSSTRNYCQKECIPLGCVPPACRLYPEVSDGGGVCLTP